MFYVKKDYYGHEYDVIDTEDGIVERIDRATLVNLVKGGVNIYGVSKGFRVQTFKNVQDIVNKYQVKCQLAGLPTPEIQISEAENGVINGIMLVHPGSANIKSFIVPDFITVLGDFCFNHNLVETVYVPPSVTLLEYKCFNSCTNLRELTGCEGVHEIAYGCFNGCTSLELPYFPKLHTLLSNAFDQMRYQSKFKASHNLRCLEGGNFKNMGIVDLSAVEDLLCGNMTNFEARDFTINCDKLYLPKKVSLAVQTTDVEDYRELLQSLCAVAKEIHLREDSDPMLLDYFKGRKYKTVIDRITE